MPFEELATGNVIFTALAASTLAQKEESSERKKIVPSRGRRRKSGIELEARMLVRLFETTRTL